MATVAVWMLIMAGAINGGGLGAVQFPLFPTQADCEKVANAASSMQGGRHLEWKCVATNVMR